MIVTNVLYRTFFIKAEQYGTAFTVDVDGAEYLVTARHLIDTSKSAFCIRLFRDKKWQDIPARVVGNGRGEIDISVLQLPFRLTHPTLEVTLTCALMALGQEVCFLGFPYKMWSDLGSFMHGIGRLKPGRKNTRALARIARHTAPHDVRSCDDARIIDDVFPARPRAMRRWRRCEGCSAIDTSGITREHLIR